MSTALAIASVSAVLKSLLENWLAANNATAAVGGSVTVSALAPDRIDTAAASPANQLNLFLYQATPNQGWRNVGLPSRDHNGERVANPPLGLDLHYMLTAYGAEQLHAEILLGFGMQLFHETPVLTRDAVRNSLGALPAALQSLAGSEVADQVEQIKMGPQAMNSEEISKLWAAFGAKYRPTAAYQASVVLIETRRSVRPTLPVRERRLHVLPFRRPFIESVSPQIVLSGGTISIEGQNLKGATTKVGFGAASVDLNSLTDQRIEVKAPVDLRAGVNTAQVIHPLDLGTGATTEPHGGFNSNVVAFILAPQITTPPPITAAKGTMLKLSVNPPVERAQQVALLVGDRTITIPARAPTDPPASDLDFPIPSDFPTGTSLLRVQVDGAQSPLGFNAGTGEYDSPTVTIT